MLARIAAYVRGLARRRAIDAEVEEELRFHVDHETDALVARGLSYEEARRQALRTLGGMTQTRDAVREIRTLWVDTLWRDARQAARGLRAAPTFTLVAILVLTLSVGASTAVYSVVDAVVLRGLPFDDSDRLVSVGEVHIRDDSADVSRRVAPQNFLDWKAMQDVFTGLAAVGDVSISLKRDGAGEPETLRAQWVTADFFSVLGVMPMLGGPFTAANEVDGRAQVAVISYGLWQRRFGGAPDVVGQRLPGQLASFAVVGVMPPSFAYPVGESTPTDVWVPYVVPAEERVRGNVFGYNLQVIGRLRDGVSLEQAQGIRLSDSSVRIRSRRDAPSADRTPSSWLRVVARTSIRLARFTHASTSTKPTAASRISIHVRTPRDTASRRGITRAMRPSNQRGVSAASTAVMRSISACL